MPNVAKNVLMKMVPYMSPAMAEHCLKEHSMDLGKEVVTDDFELLRNAALLCKKMLEDLEDMPTIPGFITYTEKPGAKKIEEEIKTNEEEDETIPASEEE